MGVVVQSVSVAYGTGGTSATLSGCAPGNALIALVSGAPGTGNSLPTPTDPAGSNTFTLLFLPTATSTGGGVQVGAWWVTGGLTGTSHSLAVGATIGHGAFVLAEVSGLNLTADLSSTQNNITAPPISVGTYALNADSMMFCLMGLTESGGSANSALTDPPTGFTSLFVDKNTVSHNGIEIAYKASSGGTTAPAVSWSWTQNGTDAAQGLVFGLQNSTAAAPTPLPLMGQVLS